MTIRIIWVVRDWLKGTYKVSMANSGLQAIKWLGKNKADLILLDYEMPVTSGPEVLKMLRSDEDTKHIPVFFLMKCFNRAYFFHYFWIVLFAQKVIWPELFQNSKPLIFILESSLP